MNRTVANLDGNLQSKVKLALIAISYTSAKQEDDWVTDSENTFAMWKEMTRTHPNQSLDTLIFLIILNSIWQFAAFPYTQAVRKAVKHQNKHLSSKLAPLIPTESTSAFHSTNLSCFLVTIFPPMVWLHFLHINPHTTHNSSNRSDEGLTLETSAFLPFMVANLRFQPSC